MIPDRGFVSFGTDSPEYSSLVLLCIPYVALGHMTSDMASNTSILANHGPS